MRFEACFLLPEPPTLDLLIAFAASFEGRLDRLQITESSAAMKSRTGAVRRERIVEAFEAEHPPLSVYLFQRGRDGNDNHPAYDLGFERIGFLDGPNLYSLFAGAPADEEPALADAWWTLAAAAGVRAGNGYVQPTPVTHLAYGRFFAGSPLGEEAPTLRAWQVSVERLFRDRAGFLPVVEGGKLRNVLRHNFLPAPLAEEVEGALTRSGAARGGFTRCSSDRVVWTLPDAAAERAAHEVLSAAGLVWEAEWLDLSSRRPNG